MVELKKVRGLRRTSTCTAAAEGFDHSLQEGFGQKNFKSYLFEAVMDLLGGRGMWDAYNP